MSAGDIEMALVGNPEEQPLLSNHGGIAAPLEARVHEAEMEADSRLHEAARAQDEPAMRGLIAAGASLAALDRTGQTPLHVCVAEKLLQPLQVLLSYEGAASVKDASGWPLLHAAVVHRWIDGVRELTEAGADLTVFDPEQKDSERLNQILGRYTTVPHSCWSSYLKQTAIHLAVDIGDMAILECLLAVAEKIDNVNCLNRDGQTPLYTAIDNEYLSAIKALMERGASLKVSNKNETVFHVAARTPYILKYFLDHAVFNGTDYDDNGFAPIHTAVTYREHESVELITQYLGISCLLMKVTPGCAPYSEMTPLHIAAYQNDEESTKVAGIILTLDKKTMNEVDGLGDTPIHTAAKRTNRELVSILLRKGAVLTTKGHREVTVLKLIAVLFDDASEFIQQIFDNFVCSVPYDRPLKVDVDVRYQVLAQKDGMSQINAVEELVKNNQSQLLLHPYIESLLHLKWCQILWIFRVMIGVFAAFLITSNMFVLNVFYYGDDKNSTAQVRTKIFEIYGGWYWLWAVILYLSILLLFLQELFKISLRKHRYFFHLESWVQLSGLALAALVPAAHAAPGWAREAACAALLLVWLMAMFLLAKLPTWGDYVFMFGRVAYNMMKIFASTIFIVIAFAFCFMIQYHSAAPFDGLFNATVKTLVMMTSEFDYGDLFGDDHEQIEDTRYFVTITFVFFLFLVSIVLMNFMVGVAVSDISELNTTASIRRLEKQLELISTMETLIYDGCIPRIIRRTHKKSIKRKYFSGFTFALGRRTDNVVEGHLGEEVKFRNYVLPGHVYKGIAEIAVKKLEQEEVFDSKSKRRYKIDALYDAIVDRPVKMEGISDRRRWNDSGWLRQVISRQNEQMRMLQQINEGIQKSITDLKLNIVLSVQGLEARIETLSHANTRLESSVVDMKSGISILKSDLVSLKAKIEEK